MGRLKSALQALCFVGTALWVAAQLGPGPMDHSVAQALAFASPTVAPTLVYFLPFLSGSCAPACGALATATQTATPFPTSTPSPSPSATPVLSISDTPTATTTPTSPPIASPSATPSPTPASSLVILPAVADTFIVEGTTWQGDSNFGDFRGMMVGYDDQGWRRERALMQFDISAVPKDAVVVHARLEAFVHNCFYCEPMNVDALRVTDAWRELEATWNNSVTLPGEPYGRGIMLAPGRWLSVDVTALVNDWRRDVPNHGLMLVGREAPPHDWWSIEAREDGAATAPRIVVSYLPPLQPPGVR